MNRDEGSYQLSHVWDKLLLTYWHHEPEVIADEDLRLEVEMSVFGYIHN